MEKNREMSISIPTSLERLNQLLNEAAESFHPCVEKLNLKLLRGLEQYIQQILNVGAPTQLYNELAIFSHEINRLRNALIDRETFLDAVARLQPNVAEAVEREQLLCSVKLEVSHWTNEQLKAFDELCKTLHLG